MFFSIVQLVYFRSPEGDLADLFRYRFTPAATGFGSRELKRPITGQGEATLASRSRDARGQHIQIEVSFDGDSGSPQLATTEPPDPYSLTPDLTLLHSTPTGDRSSASQRQPRPCDIVVHGTDGEQHVLVLSRPSDDRPDISQSYSNDSTQPTSPSSSYAYKYGFCTTYSASV